MKDFLKGAALMALVCALAFGAFLWRQSAQSARLRRETAQLTLFNERARAEIEAIRLRQTLVLARRQPAVPPPGVTVLPVPDGK